MLTFDVEPTAARREPAVPPKVAAARNAEIAGVVASTGSPNERLSPDVEVPARRLGHAVANQVLVYVNGWRHQGGGRLRRQRRGNADNRPKRAEDPVRNGRGPDVSGPLAAT